MYIAETYTQALILLLITMICWGSWPNMQKLTSKSWRFELFYWDYVIGILLIALLLGITIGSNGHKGRGFFEDISLAQSSPILSAALSGAIFNAGNILFIAAISIAGISVAFPVGAGLALTLGVLINYIATPLGAPLYIFAGVAFIAIAIVSSAMAYRMSSGARQSASPKGLILSVLAGLLFAFFYRFLAAAMVTDFDSPEPGRLAPYSAVFFFACGVLLSNFIFNTWLMRHPVQGTALRYGDYFRGKAQDHIMGIGGGMIWGLGLALSIISAGHAGYAISFGLGQGNAMIAAIWGVFIWKEFKGAPATSQKLIWLMFFSYVAGLSLIIISRNI